MDKQKSLELIIKWCDEETKFQSRTIVKREIHAVRDKHVKLRRGLKLNELEIEYLKSNDILNIKEDIDLYIKNHLKDPVSKDEIDLPDNHPLYILRYKYGICCRGCLEVCHRIKDWKVLGEGDMKKVFDYALKSIHKEAMYLE